MKQDYEIVGFQMIHHDQLAPHPDVQLPIDPDDSLHMDSSIDADGVMLPILVSAKPNAQNQHWIYDGVNRWRSACKSPTISGLPCILANVPDPRKFALICLGTGRKRSTGQRIMAYLEMHKANVLKVAKDLDGGHALSLKNRDQAGHLTGPVITGVLKDFTAESMALKLGVSDKDVRLGIELMCTEEAAPKDKKELFSKQMLTLLAGGGSIRRWKAAVGGKLATAGKTRALPDYRILLPAALVTVRNGFEAWPKLDWASLDNKVPDRDSEGAVKQAAMAMLKVMPDVIRAEMRSIILEQWPEHEREDLRLALVAQKKRAS